MLRLLATSLFAGLAVAEDGLAAWLRYAPYPGAQHHASSVPTHIVALNTSTSSPIYVAGQELQQGIQSIFGTQCNVHHSHWGAASSIVVGTVDEYNKAYGNLAT